MPTIQNIIEPMQTVLRDATAIAGKTSGFIRRPAMGKMSAETFVTSLVFACMGERQPTLDDFAANSATMGAPVSPQAFDDRFSLRAVACLRQVLETALRQRILAAPRAVPLLAHFTDVYLADCTVLDVPDAVVALCQPALIDRAAVGRIFKDAVRVNGQRSGGSSRHGHLLVAADTVRDAKT